MMIPIRQTIHHIEPNGDCLVISQKGNIYPVKTNPYVKHMEVGDIALVTKNIKGEWSIVDVENKYPRHLDITEFPKTDSNDLNWIEYQKYLKIIEDMREPERVRFDNHLRKVFCEKYGMKHMHGDEAETVEPHVQAKLEDYV